MELQAEIERNRVHKPGQRMDLRRFENQYKSQIDRWVKSR